MGGIGHAFAHLRGEGDAVALSQAGAMVQDGFPTARNTEAFTTNPTLALLARRSGIWEGRYIHLDAPTYQLQEALTIPFRVECPAADGTAYRQTSRNWSKDGHA